MTSSRSLALNAICPYFTMFPIEFPLNILRRAEPNDWVLDPFSGRGTTNYAARVLGLSSIGIDSSRVAMSLTEAKLVNTTPDAIVSSLKGILRSHRTPNQMPQGEFWDRAYSPRTLNAVCRVREALQQDCRSDSRKALRAIVMGALHGPRNKFVATYFSNQCPRTYAPKPRYAVKYWRKNRLRPPEVNIMDVIRTRAERYYTNQTVAKGIAIFGDSRDMSAYRGFRRTRPRWIVTSPPYYGMRTYIPDQWLRNWFLGGPSDVDYSMKGQLSHASAEGFAAELESVWMNIANVSAPDARLIVRFGGIADRCADPLEILKDSIAQTPWRVTTAVDAGSSERGKRQANHFAIDSSDPQQEWDVWLTKRPR